MTAPTDARAFLRALFDTAVARAQPAQVLAPYLPPPPLGRTVVVGAGKAAASMAAAVDALWPADAPFAEAVNYFPAPLLALRTCKSDSIVGLPAGLAESLDKVQNDWRFNGKHGLIQFYKP